MDIVNSIPTPDIVPPCDFLLILFVLSSVSPDQMEQFIQHASKPLKSGGILLFRDYAFKDHAQLRFKPEKRLAENFYVRQDGTRSYFFKQDEVISLFNKCGFELIEIKLIRRKIVNRKEQKEMHRLWINSKFRKV